MSGRDPVTRATDVQREAARPDLSVAVRASAGSGKTRVLIDRFVRLCTEGEAGGVHPRSILAITFTRKAATEIRERLMARARELALATDDERGEILTGLFAGRSPRPLEEDRAARLYERLLEDPGGLQVGTIHSFCQRILARFATEAGLDPFATLMEDRDDLLDEAIDKLAVEVARDGELAILLDDLGGMPGAMNHAVRAVFGEQMRVDRWLRRLAASAGTSVQPRAALLPAAAAEQREFLGVDDDPAVDLPACLAKFAGKGIDGIRKQLGAEDLDKAGKYLDALSNKSAAAIGVDAARDILLTTTGTVRKFVRAGGAELKDRCQDLILAAATDVLDVLRSCDLRELWLRNRAHLTLGLRALDILDELKRRDRVIDFGDLEDLACRLMGDEARAMSLLFRLEDSITHILVDEFQDTNFNQRDILAPFVEEFLAGGEEDGHPTVFFVGDLKQSIYGFRGAEPAIFADMMALMDARGLPVPSLPTNFRSLPAVVDGVGQLFTSTPLMEHLPVGEEDHVHQETARREAPGVLVTLEAYDKAPDGRTGDQVAADAAARMVRGLVDGGEKTWDGWGDTLTERPLAWSDVLVLYRSRTGVSLYEEAFRAAGIPIEPAGRGMLAASREVQDMLALLRWLVWSDDDVALATVLRSPIFRLPEDLFQQLLAARGLARTGTGGKRVAPTTLWSALRKRRDDDPRLEEAASRLEDWRGDTGFVGIHELLRRIYREGHVPERYAAAAGEQARVNLDRLYDLALGPEMTSTPTVRRFIDLVDKAGRRGGHDEGTSGGGDRVRFLTIHGAKGLEAPVVLLVDADRALAERNTVIRLDPADGSTGVLFGATRRFRDGFGEDGPQDALQQAGARATATSEGEETNLLYVALTRARDRLYVLGGKSSAKDDGAPRTYLRRLRMAAGDPVRVEDPDHLERPPVAAEAPPGAVDLAGPGIQIWNPPRLVERAAVVTPSSVGPGGEDAPATPIPAGAVDHGLRVHLLLQLAAERGALPAGDSPAHAEARAVFEDPRLEWLFRPETVGGQGFSEAPVIQRRLREGTEERLTGIIDRLIVRPDRVDIVDYKTNRWGGDPGRRQGVMEKYAPQLAAYSEATAALFPDRPVHAWLLMTDPAGRNDQESGLWEFA